MQDPSYIALAVASKKENNMAVAVKTTRMIIDFGVLIPMRNSVNTVADIYRPGTKGQCQSLYFVAPMIAITQKWASTGL